jgi:hypothetical protein
MSPSLGAIAVILAAALVGFAIARLFDRDSGGYVDKYNNMATYPKKIIHLVFAGALCFMFAYLMPPIVAAAGVVLVGAAYEKGQGYFSWLDLAADAVGAALAALYVSRFL